MKRLRRIPGFLVLAMALAVLADCTNPSLDSATLASGSAASPAASPAAGAFTPSLTLAWNSGGSRSILPASYPVPTSYDITLHPASGGNVTRSVAATTCTFDGLQAVAYAVSVSGRDSVGRVVVSGTGSADMRSATPVSSTIVLNYIATGVGTGQMHLTFSSATAVTGTPTLTLVSPSGVVSSGIALAGSSPTFSYTNASVAAGSWKLFSSFASGTKSAMKLETVLVLQNVDTVGTLVIADTDFGPTLVPVSGLALNASTMTLATGGATGSLAATLTPANPSNALVAWTSSVPFVASVSQGGLVTPLSAGTATITATSVDHPAATAACVVTVLATYAVTYDANGATGTAPATQTKVQGTGLNLVADSSSLARTGYTFGGWSTKTDGTGIMYAVGSSYTTEASLVLFAKWTINTFIVTYSANSSTGGSAPSAQTKTYGTVLALATNSGTLVRTGYTFTGWNTVADGTGTTYATEAIYSANAAVTLFAKWSINYGVTYAINGATGGTAPAGQTKVQGMDLTLAANSGSLVRTDYSFAGWNTAANGSGTNYGTEATYTADAALTLFAKWTVLPPTADLTSLALSGNPTGSPTGYVFSHGTYTYSGITLPNSATGLTVTPTGAGAITVNSVAVTSGSASASIALNAGSATTIKVVTTEAGKTTKVYTLSVTRLLAVGNSYGGGIVAYIFVSGDTGYSATAQHGLIAATVEQSAGIRWTVNGSQTDTSWGTKTGIGTGSANTDVITTHNGTLAGYAAGLARAYTDGVYHDWFLPSKDELNKLYLVKTTIGANCQYYWSSSEFYSQFVWCQDLSSGAVIGNHANFYSNAVRAVRAF